MAETIMVLWLNPAQNKLLKEVISLVQGVDIYIYILALYVNSNQTK